MSTQESKNNAPWVEMARFLPLLHYSTNAELGDLEALAMASIYAVTTPQTPSIQKLESA
jgi:hypothetical protein